jgi:hypothetical protein
MHHDSGARIATTLLSERGYSAVFCAHVAEIIQSHLKVTESSSVEGAIIYDADTIDSNIGLPALYRNLMINLRGRDRQAQGRGLPNADEELTADPEAFFRPWILERLPGWVSSKHRDFVVRMNTDSAKELADARIERLGILVEQLAHELSDFDTSLRTGRLAVLWSFAVNRKGAMLSRQLGSLRDGWRLNGATPGAGVFLDAMHEEVLGRC